MNLFKVICDNTTFTVSKKALEKSPVFQKIFEGEVDERVFLDIKTDIIYVDCDPKYFKLLISVIREYEINWSIFNNRDKHNIHLTMNYFGIPNKMNNNKINDKTDEIINIGAGLSEASISDIDNIVTYNDNDNNYDDSSYSSDDIVPFSDSVESYQNTNSNLLR